MSLRWTRAALDDVAGVFAYISRENERAAMRVVDGLMAAAASLEAHPQMGRPGRVRGTRELVVGKYVVVYRAKQDVVIVRVIHGARRRS